MINNEISNSEIMKTKCYYFKDKNDEVLGKITSEDAKLVFETKLIFGQIRTKAKVTDFTEFCKEMFFSAPDKLFTSASFECELNTNSHERYILEIDNSLRINYHDKSFPMKISLENLSGTKSFDMRVYSVTKKV